MAFVDYVHAVPERAIAIVANTGIFGGAASAIGGWLAGQNLIGLGGLFIGALGLFVNWHHKKNIRSIEREKLTLEWERFKRDEQE